MSFRNVLVIFLGASFILCGVGCGQAAITQKSASAHSDATVSAPAEPERFTRPMAEAAVEPARLSANGKALMRAFYEPITTVTVEDPLPEVTAEMYGHLATARRLAGDSVAVRRRIDDLIVYTRYVELYHQYMSATEAAKEATKAALLTYIWRMRETMMIHAYAIWCRLVGEREANDPASPLKSDQPIKEDELLAFLKQK